MRGAVILSVDGGNGLDDPDGGRAHPNQELTRATSTSIHGVHGADARDARRGGPAGFLSVELLESQTSPEGFIVRTLSQVPEGRNLAVTEVPSQRDLVLTAIGGDGEAGRRGEDGQDGRDGMQGVDATKDWDATPGTAGGDGGNAGAGTNGAPGGDGGKIRIYVTEDTAHLLLATSWHVEGGKGGVAGEHGTPGLGGKGGKGGQGFTWKEQNGYQYKCTPNCAGRTTAPASSVSALSRRHDPLMALVHGIGQQVSAESNIQTAVVRLANYRANTVRDTTGLCECSGGSGHCLGCDALPVFQARSRVPGGDGGDGQSGMRLVDPLFPGTDGEPGEGMIIVRSSTAGLPDRVYRSPYQLELVDFDVEDENDDGIFEPGEHLFIRRIHIKNTGGMPSPARKTRIEVDASDCLHSITGNDGIVLVPSIPSGHTVTLPGSIKVLIREPDILSFSREAYRVVTKISLKATMTGLNRRLDHFDYQKPIEIQYPLELQHINYLQSVALGSENKISMQIYNKATRVFGDGCASPRRAELRISIPSEFGTLLAVSGAWIPEVFQNPGRIGAKASVKISQTLRISHRAKDHDYTTIHVQLLISSLGPPPAAGRSLGDLGIPMNLIQSFDLKIQISATHVYDEQAGILLVTNVKTPPDQFEAIREFIHKDLRLKMDVWNVSQYGGLIQQEQNEEDEKSSSNILNAYRGRTIILLGNKFDHFGVEEQTFIDLCESRVIVAECFAGSSCLLLGAAAEKERGGAWLMNCVFPVSHTISDIPNQVAKSATFNSKASLIRSLSERRSSGILVSQAYRVESKPKWYYGGAKMTVRRQARQIQNHLRAKLPRERFWVCPVQPRIDGGKICPGYIAVWHGLPTQGNVFATEPKELKKMRGRPPKLHPFESFNIIRSLPCRLRARLLCSFDKEPTVGVEDSKDGGASITSQNSANYSDDILNAVQYSLEEDVTNEIQDYLNPSPIINNISLDVSKDPADQFSIHFPCVETVLEQFNASDNISTHALLILQTTIAATEPQNKRQIMRNIAFPIGQRRAQLKCYLIRRVETILAEKGYSPANLKEFRLTTKAKMLSSRFGSSTGNISKLIEDRNRKFAEVSTNEYRNGRQTTRDLVQGTQMCSEDEWDAKFREIEQTEIRLQRRVTRAMTTRGRMSAWNLNPTRPPSVHDE